MNDLTTLSALGLEWPSPTYLIGSILFGIVGYVAYRRGRKASRPPLTWGGVALMAYPIAISETWQLWAIGAALCGWVYAKWN